MDYQRGRLALLLPLIVLWCFLHGCAASQRNDVIALIQFRDSIENWAEFQAANNLTGWVEQVPVCIWGGVTCNEQGRVIALSIDCSDTCAVKATGMLEGYLGNMTALITLDLGSNLFYGPLPLSWGQAGQFPALENLYVSRNNISGPIPWSGNSSFPRLGLMRIEGNQLTGPLPADLVLPSLLIFRAFHNELSGPLDPNIAINMPNLQILALSGNAFTGTLPAIWGNPDVLRNLQEMYLQGNQIEGGLPPNWGGSQAFPSLRFLNLAGNPLGGTLPPEWGGAGSFPRLASLTLNVTGIEGPLPEAWARSSAFATIEVIKLEGNNLSGNLDVWSEFTSLQLLIIKPGNDGICIADADVLPFRLCDAADLYCISSINSIPGPDCPVPPGAEAALPPGTAPPQQPAAETSSDDDDSSSVVAIAVAVPVGVLAALSALGLLMWWRHRTGVAPLKRDDTRLTTAHPFDTEEGQQKFTSPFAPSFDEVNEVAAAGAPPNRNSISGSQQYSSSEGSRFGSVCARISTKSIDGSGDSGAASGAGSTIEPALNIGREVEMRRRVSTDAASGSVAASGGGITLTEPTISSRGGRGMDLPFSDWEIDPKDIEILKKPDGSLWELGAGGFGKVYKALRDGVQPVAVKVLSAVNTLPGAADRRQADSNDFKREIAILKACRDTNIVQFQGAHLGPDQTMLVTEYMEAGNLSTNIQAGRVTWYKRGRKIASDVAKGLVFLHSRRIVHFDLKSPNILLARDGTAKIADVGMAKFLARGYVTGVVGTLSWAAPEMLWGQKCSEKADIYSYGIVLWEICTGERPVRGQLRDVKPEECPDAVRQLMLECLDSRPSRRPSALQLVERLGSLPSDPGPRQTPVPPASPMQRVSTSSQR